MQIVIDISEDDYKIMKHNIAVNNPLCPLSQEEMVSKVASGTPLPKGHGRLKDADHYIKMQWEHPDYSLMDDEPTIIEADKTKSEG